MTTMFGFEGGLISARSGRDPEINQAATTAPNREERCIEAESRKGPRLPKRKFTLSRGTAEAERGGAATQEGKGITVETRAQAGSEIRFKIDENSHVGFGDSCLGDFCRAGAGEESRQNPR